MTVDVHHRPVGLVLLVVDDAALPVLDRFLQASTERGLAVTRCPPEAAAPVLADLVAAGEANLAVVGWGEAGEPALEVAANEGRVAAVALVAAPVSEAAVALIGEWPEIPVLGLADPADRAGLRGAVDAYLASSHAGSDLVVRPLDDALTEAAEWLAARLAGAGRTDEVLLHTADGWILHATRRLPVGASTPVPGVVLLHSGRSDRAAFSRLEQLLVEAGLAVLNVDWRGRGQSTNQGTYFALSAEERAEGWRDAAAAFDHLAACAEVDAPRLAAVGVIHGAEHAVRASERDARVRALAILTGYRPGSPEESAHLTGGEVRVLYVTSTGHHVTTEAMHALYQATPPGQARYVEYPGGAIGYQLFDTDPALEPAIVAWLVEALSP